MVELFVDKSVKSLVEGFELPEKLGFGVLFSPAMFVANYRDGGWDGGAIVPYGPLEIYPAAKVLNYAQAGFEGFKAYMVKQNRPQLFRPAMNFRRLNSTAERLFMPEVPEDLFFRGLNTLVSMSAPLIPRQHNASLYIRPVMFGATGELGIGPARQYTLVIIASPSALYSKGIIRVLIEREHFRAAPGGLGHVKASANYAGTIQATAHLRDHSCHMSLSLDPVNRKNVEELSGMNFFCVIDDVVVTPQLTGTLLSGVTRDSILQLARHNGIKVQERALGITEIIDAIRAGTCTEAFGAGTAAVVTPIEALVEHDGTEYQLPLAPGPLSERLREDLLNIQEGCSADPFGWMVNV